ncbi:MAG: hypothetical protein ABJF88_03630 [Rhodothermales bacterium]
MMKVAAILFLAAFMTGCATSNSELQHEEIRQSSDWWRPIVTLEQASQIAGAEEAERRSKARSDSLGRDWSGLPLEYEYFLNYDQLRDPEAAFALLLNTRTFASSHVGIAGSPSEQYEAFNTLLRRADAPEVFSALLRRAYPAGQLYALSGLYLTDRGAFYIVVGSYETSQDSVSTQMGCVGDLTPVAEIVRHPRGIRLAERQSLAEWYEANHGDGWRMIEPSEVYAYDIVGGAWPQSLDARDH